MHDELIKRLRTFGAWADVQPRHALVKDAADTIERLQARVAELEATVRELTAV